MKKFALVIKLNLIFSILFSFLCLSFHKDVSIFAFPLSVCFTFLIYLVPYKELIKKNSVCKINFIRHVFQYEPFAFISAFVIQRAGKYGFNIVFDFLCVGVWVLLLAFSLFIQFYLSEKRIGHISPDWKNYLTSNPYKKPKGIKRFVFEILEWIDALLQAVFTIMLLNIFIFQLYEIPSESMVPTFLIKDRVIVFKTPSGPKFPLSSAGLPYFQKYKRGDIVVFRNPHYGSDRKNEVQTFFSQFIYMCSLTLLKTNTDEHGELKADPLVKRVTAVSGEQIYMLDGNLYARTKNENEFKIVEKDKTWAAWNLNTLPEKTKSKIETIPLSQKDAELTLQIEEQRRNLDLARVAKECEIISKEFKTYAHPQENSKKIEEFFSPRELFIYNLFSNINNETISLLTMNGGSEWVDSFLNDWHRENDISASYIGGDAYTDANFRLNAMAKLLFGQILIRNAKLLKNEVSISQWQDDTVRQNLLNSALGLCMYVIEMDLRNLPVFPTNDANGNASYIPENCYFMMGDNRYNSLDMRHSYEQTLVPVTKLDSKSINYYTNLEPQYVNRERILGKASFRFWPLNRIGILNNVN